MVDASGTGRAAPGIDASRLRAIVAAYRDVLDLHRADLNRLNVYPVPDGDTGTNMSLTLESVVAEVEAVGPDLDAVCTAIAHGSLMGARGNSGVILSQILRGLAERVAAAGGVSATGLVDGLRAGSEAAYAAVLHPVEGTILTVAREAADAAATAATAGDLVAVLDAARAAAHDAVARTPDLLPALAQAGVVDAGGRGFALFFDACLHVCDGRPVPEPAVTRSETPTAPRAPVAGPRYEVMFLLAAADDAVPAFRAAWDALGESIVVVGGDGLWNCHVHTDDIGGAIEAGVVAGRPSRIEVTDLFEQVHDREADWVADAARPAGPGEAAPPAARPCAVVAVAAGDGATRLFAGLGAAAVVSGGQSMNPSTQQILDAVVASAGDSVVVLPNNKNIVAVAEQAAALADRPVVVVPTRSVLAGLAAMIEFDDAAAADDNAASMAVEAGRVRVAEITRAVRASTADCGPIAVDDWIAVTAAGICVATTSPVLAAVAALAHIVTDDAELCTVLVGAEAEAADVEALRAHLAGTYPELEVEVHDGGQPLYPFLLGVE